MTLLFYLRPRLFDSSDIFRKKKEYEKHEEEVAAQLLKAILEEQDIEIPKVKTLELKEALGNKLVKSVNEKEKQALKLLLIMLAMED